MKRLSIASLGVALGLAVLWTQTALAADMPRGRGPYMPPPRAPAYVPFFSWSGFYVGLNAAYGFGNSRWTNTITNATTGDFDVSGAILGGTMGYNIQLGGSVVGVEGDIAWSGLKGSSTVMCVGTCETKNTWLATARGRIGYAFDRFLPYFTGGAAIGEIKASTPFGGSLSNTNVGWTAGGGLEYAFVNNWSAKFEYLYVDLGKMNCQTCAAPSTEISLNSNIVRAGVNYKF
jgi:outer membrane immunogenic protein